MSKYASYRHPFKYQQRNGKTLTFYFAVVLATQEVDLALDTPHVLEAIKRNGVADTQNCSGACLIQDSADQFPHAVEGTADFWPSRAFVMSELFKEPRKFRRGSKLMIWGVCYEYEHSSLVWKYNDDKDGQRKLLAKLQKEGPMKIVLRPGRKQDNSGSPKPGGKKRDNSRKNHRKSLRGHEKRVAHAINALQQ